jgi:uncharacterized protein
MNRLAQESSPYLLQHAHNPVDWYPWTEEALTRARQENRPIFLSVGYSTCYWCHVMERECFENPAIAAEMNRLFVNIKVDREQRPDLDQLYMTAVQVITHQGGWPMSVFLTPDLKPFYAGTYFPPTDHYGRPGFPRVLAAVADAYSNRADEVNASAEQITSVLRQLSRPRRPSSNLRIDQKWIDDLIQRSVSDFDEVAGGFGSAPKFPRETLLELLLVYLRDKPNAELTRILTKSLDAMAYGGIRDHLGGGFHRYSTDARWLVPHFEIMLYDNAMLLWVYAEAYRQTGLERYAAIARGIADFILREMTSPDGTFFTALDAEVDGKEGDNYLWTRQQVLDALSGKADAAKFLHVYGLNDGPNFADPHHGNGVADKNVLFLAEPDDGASLTDLDLDLDRARQILYQVRKTRKQPRLDHKILPSWNALMIRGLAHAGAILSEPKYSSAATTCADAIFSRIAKDRAFLDDYAFLSHAMFSLNRRGQAEELARIIKREFSAGPDGGFFFTDARATDLIARQMIGTDSPLPSGNGVAAIVLAELGDLDSARSTLSAFAAQMDSAGESMSTLLQAALLYVRARGPIDIAPDSHSDRPLPPTELALAIVHLTAKWDGPTIRVTCQVKHGYHLNPSDSETEPTRLTISGADIEEIEYPPGELTGQFEILITPKRLHESKLHVNLSYQACNDNACLPPVTRSIELAPSNS